MAKHRAQTTGPTPPRTAYDTMQIAVRGFGDVARGVAHSTREARGPDDLGLLDDDDLARNDQVQAFFKKFARDCLLAGMGPEVANGEALWLAQHLGYAVNHELHRRKTFWVDPPLAWALANTNLDLPGALLRLPFPCCALVFTDPTTRALADELYQQDPGRHSDEPIKVVTVYLSETEDHPEGGRGLHAHVCLDGLTGEWPYLLGRDLLVEDDADLEAILASHFPGVDTDTLDPVFDAPALKRLLHLAINAVLYATSAGVEIQTIPSPIPALRARLGGLSRPRRRTVEREIARFLNKTTGEDVFFLPGKIDIRQVERIQAAARAAGQEGGRVLMTRFMVRGHWHRAAPSWKDQRPRWIEPYWKGPDLATIIERDYRLKG